MKVTFQELKATGNLPSPTGVGMAILKLTSREDYEIDDLVNLVQADAALTGRLLKMANSARAAGVEPITTVTDATLRLGANSVRNVALGFSLLSSHRTGHCHAFPYDLYWSESLARAVFAQGLARYFRGIAPADGFVCGLLGGIGRLALATTHPTEFGLLLERNRGRGRNALLEEERRGFFIDHIEIARALLLDWGLPDAHSEAVAGAEDAALPAAGAVRLSGVVWMATRLADAVVGPAAARAAAMPDIRGFPELLHVPPERFWEWCDGCVKDWAEWGTMLEIAVSWPPPFAELARGGCEAPEGARAPSASAAPEAGAPAAGAVVEEEGPAGPRLRILAVDDDRVSLRLLQRELERAGHTVITASDGEEGLRRALEDNPQMVITDWQMPRLDGIDLCRALRRFDAGRAMYVLILTGSEEEDRLVEAFESGADDYITKPWKRRVLLSRVRAGQRVVDLQDQVAADHRRMQEQVAELGNLTRQLELASLTDALTGLSNRRHAIQQLTETWAKGTATGSPLALIMVDLDHFKKVNDEHGHDMGDLVLKECGAVLQAGIRGQEQVFRIGGEEFLVICPGATAADAQVSAERLRAGLERHVIHERGFNRPMTASLGVAARTDDMMVPDDVIKSADVAVYESKRLGRNRVTVRAPSPPRAPAGAAR